MANAGYADDLALLLNSPALKESLILLLLLLAYTKKKDAFTSIWMHINEYMFEKK